MSEAMEALIAGQLSYFLQSVPPEQAEAMLAEVRQTVDHVGRNLVEHGNLYSTRGLH